MISSAASRICAWCAAIEACASHAVRLLIAVSYVVAGFGSPGERAYLAELRGFLVSRQYFLSSAVMQTVIFAQVVSFLFMCQGHPAECDSCFQLVLMVALSLLFVLIGIATDVADKALAGSRVLGLSCLRAPADLHQAYCSRPLHVPTPPPQALLPVV